MTRDRMGRHAIADLEQGPSALAQIRAMVVIARPLQFGALGCGQDKGAGMHGGPPLQNEPLCFHYQIWLSTSISRLHA